MAVTAWPDRPRALVSFAYPRALNYAADAAQNQDLDLLVDSGAFTAHETGKSINRADYTAWLSDHHEHIRAAFTLDVIGDYVGTARNHEWMKERLPADVELVPVWHTMSPLDELHRLCSENAYIGIGGATGLSLRVKANMQHLVRAHRIAREHGTVLHGLGVTGSQGGWRLPWSTCDSSSWLYGRRHGMLILAERSGKINIGRLRNLKGRDDVARVRAFGGDPTVIQRERFGSAKHRGSAQANLDNEWMSIAAARAYMLMEGGMRRKHGTDVRLYLAGASDVDVRHVLAAHKLGNPYDTDTPPTTVPVL